MSSLPSLPSLPSPSEMQIDEHMNDERLVDEAEQARLVEYLAEDSVAAIEHRLGQILTITEPDKCNESECPDCCEGEYTHDDDCDEYYYRDISPCPKTPDYPPEQTYYEGVDY